MKVLVLVKCVPDSETRIKLGADGASLLEDDIKWIVSPFDEFALEEGLRQVEAAGDGDVTVVTLGDERARVVVRQCLAMGAHRAVLLTGDELMGSDGLGTSRALAAACRKLGFDLILAGRQSFGDDRSQVGPMVAEMLDLPNVSAVTKIEVADGKAVCEREIEGGVEVIEAQLPTLITAQKGLNEPRYASLKGIMAAKKKPIDEWGVADLDLDPGTVGSAAAVEVWSELSLPPARPDGQRLEGDAATAAGELVRLLSNEAKVI